jgi:hypothetical protein
MTLVELKAAGYDTLAQIERLQNQLRQINAAIEKEKAVKVVEKVVESKKKETK